MKYIDLNGKYDLTGFINYKGIQINFPNFTQSQ